MAQGNTEVETAIVSSSDDQPTLPVRLESPQSSGGRLAGTWIFGLLLTSITYGCVVLGQNNPEMYYAVVAAAVVIGLLAALLVWSAVQQTLVFLLIPATTVEVEFESIAPGATMRFCVKQPGPIYLKSIRANLICIQHRERKLHTQKEGRSHSRDPERILYQQNILDSDGGWLFPGQTRQWIAPLTIPQDAPDSGKADSQVTQCHIEIWGRTHMLVGFMRQYTLKVRQAE
ncbi:hypothetical protein CA54_43980 [Symmachiella macrocystis]|uniref:Uncharacterized protein n=1 Tax=Symmachiella macrocystis TaxID=2527985 RepID=A0A5C6BB06_9PLAN|nr:hypothetical protein [Symmachiella macrocystis]TWU09158.1 hypothetical protein CA54_43980 [Symmachiella macrocystis]